MKRTIALTITLMAACSVAAKTFDWPLDAPVAEAKIWTAYHGETVRFNLMFSGAMSNVTAEAIYYKTNGMDKADWFPPIPGTVFHPTNDCGAAEYRFFIKCSDPDGNNYTPNGTLRLLDSPGFAPNAIEPPVKTLDFATVTVLNPPWSDGSADLTPATNYTDKATNAAFSAAVEYTDNQLSPVQESVTSLDDRVEAAEISLDTLSSDVDLYVEDHRVDIERVERRIDETESSGNQLAQQVAAIGAHLNGEDARFVVTNYDSVVHEPEAYVEIKVSNDWIRVWNEATKWAKYETWKTNVDEKISMKADRAWGVYDSETGGYSPAGFTQVSSSNILIASGMAYQRTVTSAGSVWVLQCNQGVAQVSGDTNGFFRVMDADGVTQFEIIKGDKRTIGADADSINIVSGVAPTKLTIGYSVVSQTHPTLQICQRLESPEWKDETDADCIATVTWSGQSGAYVATVQGKENWPSMFIKASYEIGGETYIRNNAPVEVQHFVINGVKGKLGTATIDGITVLTFTP